MTPSTTETMPAAPTRRKRPITGSGLESVRLHNRVIGKLKPAARKLGLTKNGVMAKAIEQFVDAALTQTA